MREILFRGKQIHSKGEWVYGSLIQTKNCASIWSEELKDDIEVDPATVGQYTSLQDNNGSKIFEGDIVECCEAWSEIFDEDCTIRVVKYGMDNYGGNQFVYGWYFEQIGIDYNDDYGDNPGIYDEICQKRLSNCLVIGNVHDNPELLGGK